MPIAKLIDRVKDYPIEDRVVFGDAILQSINPINPAIERKWIDLAQRRRGDYLMHTKRDAIHLAFQGGFRGGKRLQAPKMVCR